MLLKGEIMTAIGYDLQVTQIGCEILAEDRVCAVFPPSHKFASQTGISSAELSAETLMRNLFLFFARASESILNKKDCITGKCNAVFLIQITYRTDFPKVWHRIRLLPQALCGVRFR